MPAKGWSRTLSLTDFRTREAALELWSNRATNLIELLTRVLRGPGFATFCSQVFVKFGNGKRLVHRERFLRWRFSINSMRCAWNERRFDGRRRLERSRAQCPLPRTCRAFPVWKWRFSRHSARDEFVVSLMTMACGDSRSVMLLAGVRQSC